MYELSEGAMTYGINISCMTSTLLFWWHNTKNKAAEWLNSKTCFYCLFIIYVLDQFFRELPSIGSSALSPQASWPCSRCSQSRHSNISPFQGKTPQNGVISMGGRGAGGQGYQDFLFFICSIHSIIFYSIIYDYSRFRYKGPAYPHAYSQI